MTRLIPWHTRGNVLFDSFCRDIDHLMGQCAHDGGSKAPPHFVPRTNLSETEAQFEVTIDLPGMKPEEFDIELVEGKLRISGERKQQTKQEGKTFHRIERVFGRFQRNIVLDGDVDSEQVSAEYKDGVLTVVVPKAEAVVPKKIEVKG